MKTHLQNAARLKRSKTLRKIAVGLKQARVLLRENDNIYPQNGGRLSEAEVCRLAGIRPALLHGRAHKESTLPALKKRLAALQSVAPKGKVQVRRAWGTRVAEWKAAHHEIADKYAIVELELVERDLRIAEQAKRETALEREIADLKTRIIELEAAANPDVAQIISLVARRMRSDDARE